MRNIGKFNKNNICFVIGKGCIVSLLLSVIFMIIYAEILVNTNIQENTMKPVIITITGLSIFIGSFISCIKTNKKGILKGIIIGGAYFIILYIISKLLSCDVSFNLNSIIIIIIGILLGGIGGIMGINIRTNQDK